MNVEEGSGQFPKQESHAVVHEDGVVDQGECDQSNKAVCDKSWSFVEDRDDAIPNKVSLGNGVDGSSLIVVSVQPVDCEWVGLETESIGLTSLPPDTSRQRSNDSRMDKRYDMDVPADPRLAIELGESVGEDPRRYLGRKRLDGEPKQSRSNQGRNVSREMVHTIRISVRLKPRYDGIVKRHR